MLSAYEVGWVTRATADDVPDRPVNAGYLRSLADSPTHRFTCDGQADPLRKPTF